MSRGPNKSGYVGTPPKSVKGAESRQGPAASPWTILTILHRRRCGEPITHLAEQYNVSPASIRRWADKWGDEVDFATTALTLKDLDDTARVIKRLRKSIRRAAEQLETLQARLQRDYGKYSASRTRAPLLPGAPIPEGYLQPGNKA